MQGDAILAASQTHIHPVCHVREFHVFCGSIPSEGIPPKYKADSLNTTKTTLERYLKNDWQSPISPNRVQRVYWAPTTDVDSGKRKELIRAWIVVFKAGQFSNEAVLCAGSSSFRKTA